MLQEQTQELQTLQQKNARQTQEIEGLQQKAAELLPQLHESSAQIQASLDGLAGTDMSKSLTDIGDHVGDLAQNVQKSQNLGQQIASQLGQALEIIDKQQLATSKLDQQIAKLNDRTATILRLLETEKWIAIMVAIGKNGRKRWQPSRPVDKVR